MRELNSKYFYGNEVSEYGQKNGRVDYRTLARSFDAVLNNDIMQITNENGIGYWECENGSEEYYEDSNGNTYTPSERYKKIEELEEELDTLKDELEGLYETSYDEESEDTVLIVLDKDREKELKELINKIEDDLDYLDNEHYDEVYQWFIIDYNGAEILKYWTNEIVYYNEALNMYLWGVTHWGTGWDYVLTDIKIKVDEEN